MEKIKILVMGKEKSGKTSFIKYIYESYKKQFIPNNRKQYDLNINNLYFEFFEEKGIGVENEKKVRNDIKEKATNFDYIFYTINYQESRFEGNEKKHIEDLYKEHPNIVILVTNVGLALENGDIKDDENGTKLKKYIKKDAVANR